TGHNKRLFQSCRDNLPQEISTQRSLTEENEAYGRISLRDNSGCIHQDGKAFFRTQAAGRADNSTAWLVKQSCQSVSVSRIGMSKPANVNCILDDGHFLSRHSCPADFDRLAFRDAHHLVHSPQEKTINAFVQSDLEILAGPSARHGQDRDIDAPRRLSPE